MHKTKLNGGIGDEILPARGRGCRERYRERASSSGDPETRSP